MKTSSLAALTTAALASLSASALAQSTDTGLRMPYQKDFWGTGHAGIEIGRSKLDVDCPPGASCDDTANAFRAFAGGRFNNIFGGEIS